VADKFDIIDKPNERSSHTHITLRGGGVVFYFGIFLFTILQGWLYPAFFLGLSLISTVSFLDDIRPLSSRLRLPLHFMAMGIMFIDLGLYALPWYFWVIALVIAVGIINAFNFMDGINGITGAYSMVALLALWYVNQYIISFADQSLISFFCRCWYLISLISELKPVALPATWAQLALPLSLYFYWVNS
jgi:UDP-N-acetylmuramyl pentapeptide phosphotransferase/UDP-N-acetylglucosamine-1-phosphate transferase